MADTANKRDAVAGKVATPKPATGAAAAAAGAATTPSGGASSSQDTLDALSASIGAR